MFNDPFHPEEALTQQKESNKRKLIAVVCAIAITAVLLAGYGLVRRYHAKQVALETPVSTEPAAKAPAVAHVTIDEPTLGKGMTTIGGVVKNISNQQLAAVEVLVEFRRRKDGKTEQTVLPVTPAQLQPQEEGAYAARFSNDEFASVRLAGVHAGAQSAMIAYNWSQGKKRPAERLQPQIIVLKRAGKSGEFINTPDNPGRIP